MTGVTYIDVMVSGSDRMVGEILVWSVVSGQYWYTTIGQWSAVSWCTDHLSVYFVSRWSVVSDQLMQWSVVGDQLRSNGH